MTEVSNVTETPSLSEVIPSEELSYETVQALCDHAKETIESKDFDRAIEILVALDKGQCIGKVSPFQKFEIVKDLCNKAPHTILKLLNREFQTFTIQLEGNWVSCQMIGEISSDTFYFSPRTTEEGEELLERATDLFEEKEFASFEKALQELLEMHAYYCISDVDIAWFVESLCDENIVAAQRFFPLINTFLKVSLEEDKLVIQANTYTETFSESSYRFRDVEEGLKAIREEEDPEEHIELYLKLAKMHEARANEILKWAEAKLSDLSLIDQIDPIIKISEGYAKCKDVESLKTLTPKLEESMTLVMKSVKAMEKATLSFHYAMIALAEKNKQAFETHVSSIKQSLSHPIDDELKEEIEEKLAKLHEEGEKAFPTDPMILKKQKV